MDFPHIVARWKWDGIRATRRRVAVAIRRTGNVFGITVHGKPYIVPRVGMRVVTVDGTQGRIVALHGRGDPETTIKLGDGRTVYLYQTALCGYYIQSKRRN